MAAIERLKRAIVILTAGFLLLGLAGCAPGDVDLVIEFMEDWARAKGIHPTNPDGSINLEGVANIATRGMGGSTGDDQADAAIDAGTVIDNLRKADELMDEGRKNRDPVAMDRALAKRPNDWSYNLSRANLALERGDITGANENRNRAGTNVGGSRAQQTMSEQDISELEDIRRRLNGQYQSSDQCATLYAHLGNAYGNRGQDTGSSRDLDMQQGYYREADRCDR